MDITSSLINEALISEGGENLKSSQVTPQKAVQELAANQQENVNIQVGIEALKQSVENDPVAQILNILV